MKANDKRRLPYLTDALSEFRNLYPQELSPYKIGLTHPESIIVWCDILEKHRALHGLVTYRDYEPDTE
jgi:hypothetical protein